MTIDQCLNGLRFLHKVKHQIHRDLKPENILMNSLGEVKLTDFGISKQLGSTIDFASSFIGTMTYMSPERIQCKPYTYASDIWSFGIIVYEMAVGSLPFPACKKLIEALQYIGSAKDIELPVDLPISLELGNFVEYW